MAAGFLLALAGLPPRRASLLWGFVSETPPLLSRHFLTWEHPLLPQAVEFLAAGWRGQGPLDLADVMVVVPTRQAGRRLREALAVHAAQYRQAVFAPLVLGTDQLIEPTGPRALATPMASLLAWTELLREIDLNDYRAVFPVDPPERSFAWALGLARALASLQRELAEGGLRLTDVELRAGDFPETTRWRQLAALEQLHDERLTRDGLIDGQAARIASAQVPSTPGHITRIVVLAILDPIPLAITALSALARVLPVQVVVYAPHAEAENFDPWGRPVPETWDHRILQLPDVDDHVHLCANPAAQAARLIEHARSYAGSDGQFAVGLADAEVGPPTESGLRAAGVAVFNPEGRRRQQLGFHHLLSALAGLARAPEFAAVASLARCPEVLAWLTTVRGAEFSAARWLQGLDELQSRHLPVDLATASQQAESMRNYPNLAAELGLLGRLQTLLTTGSFGEGVVAALTELFADQVDLPPAAWTEAVEAWMEIVRACTEAATGQAELGRADWWQLALSIYGDTRQTDDKPDGALELQGWLELPWEDAPHLVVAGLNDGRVPEAVAGDAFLPESLRVKLGLKTNEARFARDACMLQALATSRAAAGRLDLLFGKYTGDGDPLRPSRLLLRCADSELPARVGKLFRAPDLPDSAPAWRRAWRLTLPRRKPPVRVSVTSLKAWLRCPLRFYLKHVLGMTAVDPAKSELDAFDFGTLCHGALESMARDPAMRDCTDANVVREFLLSEFDRRMRRHFGRDLALPLLVQQESARQRLAQAAVIQARERAEGWTIIDVERKFELPVGGLVIVGKIDRIERHQTSGAWRVLDYKTSDAAVDPAEAHLRSVRRGEEPPAWACWTGEVRPRVWSDLQLPLYRRVLAAEAGGASVQCAYFNLPKAAGETGLRNWAGFTPELEASAWNCAQGVVAAIAAGEYWPPRELTGSEARNDEFAELFHGGAAASLNQVEAIR